MERLTKFTPIIGGDLPYNTMALRDVPSGFGFGALVYPDDRPLTYALKDKLNDFATKYFRNHEIVGTTLIDWQTYLQCDLLLNIDTMEKMLAVYEDDIAKPTQSRTIKRTYDIIDTGTDNAIKGGTSSIVVDTVDTDSKTTKVTTEGSNKSDGVTTTDDDTTTTFNDTNTVESAVTNIEFQLPIDNPNGQATAKSTSEGTTETTDARTDVVDGTVKTTDTKTDTIKSTVDTVDNGSVTTKGTTTTTDSNTEKSDSKNVRQGTEIEDWSDVGVAPNYELLNGFLDNNRSYYAVFVSFFENCFELGECLYA